MFRKPALAVVVTILHCTHSAVHSDRTKGIALVAEIWPDGAVVGEPCRPPSTLLWLRYSLTLEEPLMMIFGPVLFSLAIPP